MVTLRPDLAAHFQRLRGTHRDIALLVVRVLELDTCRRLADRTPNLLRPQDSKLFSQDNHSDP